MFRYRESNLGQSESEKFITGKMENTQKSETKSCLVDGLVFDIDGTLVNEETQEVDIGILNRIIVTLRLGRQVVIATGRNLKDADKILVSKLVGKLRDTERVKLIKNLYLVTENGSAIYQINFAEDRYEFIINTKHLLENSQSIFDFLVQEYGANLVLSSVGFKSNVKPTSINLYFSEDARYKPTRIEIYSKLLKAGFQNFKVLATGNRKFDVLPIESDKQRALEILSGEKHFDHTLLARFGDQGHIGGNDEQMLTSSNLGFLVENPQDTKQVLSEVRINHDVTRPKTNFLDEKGRAKLMNGYDTLSSKVRKNYESSEKEYRLQLYSNEIFYPSNLLNNLKFNFTGSVVIDETKLNVELNSPFFSFINSSSELVPNKRKYFLRYANQFHGRAEGFYSTEKNLVGSLENSEKRFNNLVQNALELLSFLIPIQNQLCNPTLSDQEFQLGIIYFDNLKNALLHIFHAYSYLKTLLLIPENHENSALNEQLRHVTDQVVENYFSLLNLQSQKKFVSVESIIEKIEEVSKQINFVLSTNQNETISKCVRGIMEADKPDQVNLFAINVAKEIITNYRDSKIILVGVHFGGSELPYAVKAALKRMGSAIKVEITSAHYSNYSNKNTDFGSKCFDNEVNFESSDVFLLDDSIFTGSSLATLMDLIARQGGNVIPQTMQLGNCRRLGQMMATGGANQSFLDSQISKNAVGVIPSVRAMSLERFESLEAQDKYNLIQIRICKMMNSYYKNL